MSEMVQIVMDYQCDFGIKPFLGMKIVTRNGCEDLLESVPYALSLLRRYNVKRFI